MSESQSTSNTDLLKKLRRKAELCRYCHSTLHGKYRAWKMGKEFAIFFLSGLSTALVGLYYRGIVQGELVLFAIFILSILVVLFQSLDHTVFCWTDRAAKHESAVQIWGAWIRDADFLEKNLFQYTKNLANEKLQNMQETYNNCMSQTPQIPNKKFLEYKKDFRVYLLKSKAIDSMTLDDIAKGKARG